MAYATVNPYTGETVKTFPTLTDEQLDHAIDVAHREFASWRATPITERQALLGRAASLLRADHTRYAKILTLEMGKILPEAEAEVELSAKILDYYAAHGEELLVDRPLHAEGFPAGTVKLEYDPLGVLFLVEPWNFPYYQIARVAAPQIVAGNTLLLKHASNVPQSAIAFVDVLTRAGAPEGLLQNIFIAHAQSERVLSDPRVRGVALTGSEGAGASIAALAGKYLKKSTLELGGADAFIVLEDADVAKAAKWAAFGRHWNAGQVCVSAKRLIVVDALYERFLAEYRAHVEALVPGDPLDPKTTLAPLEAASARDKLARQVREAVAHGAKAEQVGAPVPTQGAFFQPTILTGITPDNPAFSEEFFGPVTQLYRVADEDAAVELANASPYGLGGSVFTADRARGERVAKRLDTGMVYINQPTKVAADIPFGGVKRSGYGHELIDLGIHEFVNTKVVGAADIDGAF